MANNTDKTELTDIGRKQYVYTPLSDANDSDTEYNVFGVS